MKKLIFVMLLSSFFIASCTKEETGSSSSQEAITVSETPSAILTYVTENYPDAEITAVTKSAGGTSYTVTLDTYEQVTFDGNGNPKHGAGYELMCDSGWNEPDSMHLGGGHHGGRHHGGGHQGGGHHGGSHGHGISLDSIPSAISEFVNENYSGYSIHNAQYDTLCQFGVVINVMIDSTMQAHHKLIFDASGLYLALAHRTDSTNLPAAVLATLTANYPAYSIRKKAEMLTLEDGSVQYRIFLHQDEVKLVVVLNPDGTVICEQ